MQEQVKKISDELDVSQSCAMDIFYLRTRSRWSEDLEKELVKRHENGNPPENMGEFGATEETGQELLEKAMKELDRDQSE